MVALNSAAMGVSAERAVDFFDAKGDVQALLFATANPVSGSAEHPAMHPGRCAGVWLDDRCVGHVGELHPRVAPGL